MKKAMLSAALLSVALGGGAACAKEKIKESVRYAPTWEAAVEEAKLFNLPIVVHSHGFY
ncbi:MAG: hypothetical protein ACT4PV_12490 [Planctomycetaceae bacterium]